MHELSIAQSIVDIIGQYVSAEQRHCVRSVKVRIGDLAGVVPDSLVFCFSAVTGNTPLASAVLDIDHVPYRLSCASCGRESTTEPGLALCPACGSTRTRILSGTELQVVTIDLDDVPAEQS